MDSQGIEKIFAQVLPDNLSGLHDVDSMLMMRH